MPQIQYDIDKYRDSLKFRTSIVNSHLTKYGEKLIWKGGERIMDIGCGPADITRHCFLPLLPHDFKVLVCADICPNMLKTARSELLGLEHVDFLQMDIRKCPEINFMNGFDRIFSTFCFMYVADQKKALENVFQLLAPGGDCWITQFTIAPVVDTLFQLSETPKWKNKLKDLRKTFIFPYWDDPDPVSTAEKFMKLIGYEDISVALDKCFIQMTSEKEFEALVESLYDSCPNLSQEDKKNLLKDQTEIAKSLNLFKSDITEETQPMKVPHQLLLIYGRKPTS